MIMSFFIAILPLLCIFIFLFLLKQTSFRSGIPAFILTVFIVLIYPIYQLEPSEIVYSSIKGIFISFIAAYVLFFGILLFHLMNNIGAIKDIASFISQATNDHLLQVMMMVAGLSPLIESTSGFGIAFMMVAPIFIALGFERMKAALLGLVSLLAVPWGALATGTVIGSELGNIPLHILGTGTAFISIPVFVYFMMIALYIAGGLHAIKTKWKELFLFSMTFSASILFFTTFISVELAGVLASLTVSGLGLMIIKFKNNKSVTSRSNEIYTEINILKIISPYIILTMFIFVSRMVAPIREFLESHIVISFYSYSLPLLYSPGFWLLITCLLTIVIFNIQKKTIILSFKSTIKQWIPFMLTTTTFVSISEVMTEAGMTNLLANTTAVIIGTSFIYISPFIGALGGFLTGSNTGSNAMFIKLQIETAEQVGLSPNLIAFSQNASSSHATMASPSRVMLGASLCGIHSQESKLLKHISVIALGAIILIMLTTAIYPFF